MWRVIWNMTSTQSGKSVNLQLLRDWALQHFSRFHRLTSTQHRQGSWRLAFLCHGCCLCRQLKGPEPQFFSCMLQPEWFGWLIIMVDGRTMAQVLLASWHKWHWFWSSVSWGVYLSSTLSPSPPLPGYSPHSSLPTPQALLKCTECRLYKSPVSPAMPTRFTFLSCYDCISCSYHLKMIVVQRCYYILMATWLAFLGKTPVLKWDGTNLHQVWIWPLCSPWLWSGSGMKCVFCRWQSVAFLCIIKLSRTSG